MTTDSTLFSQTPRRLQSLHVSLSESRLYPRVFKTIVGGCLKVFVYRVLIVSNKIVNSPRFSHVSSGRTGSGINFMLQKSNTKHNGFNFSINPIFQSIFRLIIDKTSKRFVFHFHLEFHASFLVLLFYLEARSTFHYRSMISKC